MENNNSVLTKHQEKRFIRRAFIVDGKARDVYATVRYDDRCGNGHNSFSITGDVYRLDSRLDRDCIMGGCIHDVIASAFPALAPFIKWHLTSTDGPMHYVGNTLYWARDIPAEFTRFIYLNGAPFGESDKLLGIFNKPDGLEKLRAYFAPLGADALREEIKERSPARPANLENARASAVWPDATIDQLRDEETLKARLPALMAEFRAAVESLGFVY